MPASLVRLAIHLGAVAASVLATSPAVAEPTLVHLEVDPLPFAFGGYGIQPGIRHPALRGVRVAIGNFALDAPAVVAELGGNDGFEVQVRPGSGALYVLYYRAAPGADGFAFGGSLRYLRMRYEHDDAPGEHMITPTTLSFRTIRELDREAAEAVKELAH